MNRTIPLGGTLALALGLALTATNSGAAPAASANAPFLLPDRIKADTVVILAHPDDEGVVAPLLARDALVGKQRIVNIYLTSGEMGTDRVGDVHGPAFGYMRLTELHWTLDRLGVAMFHTLGRADLGPPDDPAQVLAKWGRDRTVRELTRYLRLLRPERVMTWIPGPASGHAAHMAAGAAALLACRAAARADAFPEQMETEGLRIHEVPHVLLFSQAEKLAYDRYPTEAAGSTLAGPIVEVIRVDEYDPGLRRRYCDLAREAMKEQRSVGLGAGLERGGPFDEPLRLIHAFDEPAHTAPALTGLILSLNASGSQKSFESIMLEVGAPRVLQAFPPQAPIPSTGFGEISIHVANPGPARAEGRAAISLPEGWTSRPGPQAVGLDAGESVDVNWSVEAPAASGPMFVTAGAVVESGGKKSREIARLAFVIERRREPASRKTP